MKVTIRWHNSNPNTVYNKLAARLGREPKSGEVRAEVARIISEAQVQS